MKKVQYKLHILTNTYNQYDTAYIYDINYSRATTDDKYIYTYIYIRIKKKEERKTKMKKKKNSIAYLERMRRMWKSSSSLPPPLLLLYEQEYQALAAS